MAERTAREQLDRVRERFTRTAQQFASFSLSKRSREAEELLALAAPRGGELAFDLACGPGTFTCAFAPRVRRIVGLDLTAALMEQGRAAARDAGLGNVEFALGDANALPFSGASFDLATCAYGLHHFAAPDAALRELGRVVRRGGRLALADIFVPADSAVAAANNHIERVRDASHARTLSIGELRAMVEAAGFRVQEQTISERLRQLDDWLRIAGWAPSDAAYAETRRLMAASISSTPGVGDTAGFRARWSDAAISTGEREIEFVQVTLLLIAERM